MKKVRIIKIIINRLRNRHTYQIHNYLIANENQPLCSTCRTSTTVKHLLSEYFKYEETRQDFNFSNHLQESLGSQKDNINNIMHFLKKPIKKHIILPTTNETWSVKIF